ncbi:hypothetical protein FJT64_003756 [Amphibalanus amphitrite]|uniref:Uncharacterized protein n=1 Tax=Amphibalanus amphitrite TaxID=1232801 RepID=A0A6A4W101_AMPAM|nr:hypothetical protein FJT64_003756 [Amphibalanus amphitrite]
MRLHEKNTMPVKMLESQCSEDFLVQMGLKHDSSGARGSGDSRRSATGPPPADSASVAQPADGSTAAEPAAAVDAAGVPEQRSELDTEPDPDGAAAGQHDGQGGEEQPPGPGETAPPPAE